MSEYVWMSSSAQAVGSTDAGSAPRPRAVASVSTGRMRLPPASSE